MTMPSARTLLLAAAFAVAGLPHATYAQDAAAAAEEAPGVEKPVLPGEVVATLQWSEENAPEGAQLVDGAASGETAIEITAESEGLDVLLASIEPKVETLQWLVTGKVKFTGVEGDGYLQMDNFVGKRPDGTPQSYFTKTLTPDPAHPMGKLNGTSEWRPVWLPFNANMSGNTKTVDKLEFRLVLPGRGTVTLSELEVREMTPADLQTLGASAAMGGGWQAKPLTLVGYTMPTGQWIGLGGALIGSTIGIGAGVYQWRRGKKVRAEEEAAAEQRRMAALDV